MEVLPSDLVLPPGVEHGVLDGEAGPDGIILDNRSGVPDAEVENVARTYLCETSAFNLRADMPMQLYSDYGGSLMARAEFRSPNNVHEEIRLARYLAERDDDVGAVLGEMIGLAFSQPPIAHHKDERTQAAFGEINHSINIEGFFAEMYREWLIASQVTTGMLFSREQIDYELGGKPKSDSMAVPLLGVLESENIRVLGNDTFGTGRLAYEPHSARLRKWLREYFDPTTTPARKHEMGRLDRVAANLFIEQIYVDPFQVEEPSTYNTAGVVYILNPKIVQRVTAPKGSWRDPRPLLTRNFPLLEAKRLLNLMDFALLQGGSNFIVVAKKGSDQRPAKAQEVTALREVVRRASKVGLIVGDHRLSFEIITPKLDELLNPSKRRLIGRKMVMAMMRVAEHSTENSTAEGMKAEMEIFSRVIESDRGILARHIIRRIYKETVRRNPSILKSPASIWFPKILLQGSQYFNEFVLKLRDRGDISRKSTVQAAGFDYDAEVQERERELAAGEDDVLIPGMVPHSSPDQPGQSEPRPNAPSNEGGRPSGSGKDDVRGKQVIGKRGDETVKAWFDEDEEVNDVVRMGETIFAVLEDFPDREIGRVTGNERAALGLESAERIASTLYVPVNPGHEVAEAKAVRLDDGLSVLVGVTPGGAIVAKCLCFREPTWTTEQAEETALRWGFAVALPAEEPTEDPPKDDPEETAVAPIEVHLHLKDDHTVVLKPEPEPKPKPDPSDGGS